jgi:hypothetical protein
VFLLLRNPLGCQHLQRLHGRDERCPPGFQPAYTVDIAVSFPTRGGSLLGDAETLDLRGAWFVDLQFCSERHKLPSCDGG